MHGGQGGLGMTGLSRLEQDSAGLGLKKQDSTWYWSLRCKSGWASMTVAGMG